MGFEIAFLGLLLTLLYIGLTGYYPGGIIVPSYLVLYFEQPERIVATLAAALLTLISFKLASHYVILFGKRRFVFMILMGGIWAFLWLQIFPLVSPLSVEFRVIGWVIPGLIANNFERQGVIITTASLATVVVLSYFLGRILSIIV